MSKSRRSFDPTAAKLAISIPAGAEDQLLTKRQAAELGGKKRAEITFQATPLRNCIKSRESALEALFTLNKKPRTAVEDGMGWANIVLKKRKDTPPLYCVPDGFGLTGEQILEMLRKEVNENPSSAEESYGLVILETLERVFPCNK